MKRFSIAFGCLATLALALILACNKSKSLEILYVEVLKKSTSVVQKDRNGNFDGEALYFKEGKLVQKGNFKKGLRQGWMTRYYADGKMEDKVLYKNDNEDGPEYGYYENGIVKYTAHWRQGKPFGSIVFNFQNGKPQLFHAYDILGKTFCILEFDEPGNVIKHAGFAVSNKIYSINKSTDSIIVLRDKNMYHNIDDLFLTVATPPYVTISIVVIINGVQKKHLSIKNNTIQIKDAFEKIGSYTIAIDEQILDNKGKPLEFSSFKAEIKKT